MTALFYILVAWTIFYLLANVILFGWTQENVKESIALKKIANLINIVYLSLILVYLFNSVPK